MVERIDENSAQLARALDLRKPIIITTLQKFPYVLNRVGQLSDRRFALILDEAHSSQSGKAAVKLREVLTTNGMPQPAQVELAPSTEYDEAAAEAAELTCEDVINSVIAALIADRKRSEAVKKYPKRGNMPINFHIKQSATT